VNLRYLGCKYIRVAIETDNEFAANIFQSPGAGQYLSGQTVWGAVQDMVNRADYAFTNSLNVRLKCAYIGAYVGVSDPYDATTGQIFTEFNEKVRLDYIQKDVLHMITGRPMGGTLQSSYIMGQANQSKLCNSFYGSTSDRAGSVSSITCNGICVQTNSNLVNYSDAYLFMAHEIGHVIGAYHDDVFGSPSIMKSGEGKQPYFVQESIDQINNYYCNQTCLNNNSVDAAFTNKLTLTLNGNAVNSTPVFINGNTKVIAIPPDPNPDPIFQLLPGHTTWDYSNPNVYVFYKADTNTGFALGSASNFTLSVSARDRCNYYYWNVPFVYAPWGARMSSAVYPVPADQGLTISNNEQTDVSVKRLQVFDEQATLHLDLQPTATTSTQRLDTSTLNNGTYYLHMTHENGEVTKKRFVVRHE
jgi:hypothetical protein